MSHAATIAVIEPAPGSTCRSRRPRRGRRRARPGRRFSLPVPALVGRGEATRAAGRRAVIGRHRSMTRRIAAATLAGSAGSHSSPSGPAGSSVTMAAAPQSRSRRPGSRRPSASKSLFGVERMWFSVDGLERHHVDVGAGDPRHDLLGWHRTDDVRAGRRSAARGDRWRSLAAPTRSRGRRRGRGSRPGSRIASASCSRPRYGLNAPWYSAIGASAGIPVARRIRSSGSAGGSIAADSCGRRRSAAIG